MSADKRNSWGPFRWGGWDGNQKLKSVLARPFTKVPPPPPLFAFDGYYSQRNAYDFRQDKNSFLSLKMNKCFGNSKLIMNSILPQQNSYMCDGTELGITFAPIYWSYFDYNFL